MGPKQYLFLTVTWTLSPDSVGALLSCSSVVEQILCDSLLETRLQLQQPRLI